MFLYYELDFDESLGISISKVKQLTVVHNISILLHTYNNAYKYVYFII